LVLNLQLSQDPTRLKEKLYDGPTDALPSFSEGKKKKEKEKQNIFCPTCAEQYEEPITED